MKEKIKLQLDHTLDKFEIPGVKHYKGKVRDNFVLDDKIVMVTSDRISAFDRVLGTIPFKGQILSEIASFWFDKTKDIVPNHTLKSPDPQVMLVKKAETLPVEVIVRGYITGSLWREYSKGINGQYGFLLPDGLKKNQQFDKPILTPSTKAEYGLHDEPIDRETIIKSLVEESIYTKAEEYALNLFKIGQEWALKQGLILVDTKYEFGMVDGELIVIDEIHTPDSSRYWIADTYEERFNQGLEQQMLDKENIRQWLLEQGFSGDGEIPIITDDIKIMLADRYIELYRTLTGKDFKPAIGNVADRIDENLKKSKII
mgnify:CR=1 FL=1